jgi:hypothetical protein
MSDNESNLQHFATCRCQHCNKEIEFDASQLAEGETSNADCPHCGLETILSVLPNDPPAIPPTLAEVQEAELEQFKIQKIIQIKALMRSRLESGKPAFLYDSIYVPVDSQLLDNEFANEFDVSMLRKLGVLGWDIVQAVPKTKGIGLENIGTDTMFGSKWAGGVGGNVMGVHIIIKKSISLGDLTDDPDDEAGTFIRSHLNDFLSE